MKPLRYSVSRRSACTQCADRKVRCDRTPGRYTRCTQRGETCHYPSRPQPKKPLHIADTEHERSVCAPSTASNDLVGSHDLSQDSETSASPSARSRHSVYPLLPRLSDALDADGSVRSVLTDHGSDLTSMAGLTQAHSQIFDFTYLNLACPISADEIQNRWLSSFIPGPTQTMKIYPSKVVDFMSRTLKSCVTVAVDSQGWPPFVHFSQTTSNTCTHPSTCLNLVRLFAKNSPGGRDAALATVQREMKAVHQSIATASDMAKLAIFQAYLIYTMILYYCVDDLPKPCPREAMINAQELACASSRGGFVCAPKRQTDRAKWEEWIVVEAKRRTLYTMYMFDGVLLSRDGLDNYLGIELSGLPAPGEKRLWQTEVRSDWEKAYLAHLAAWSDGALRIDELWPMPTDADESVIVERRRRVDQWLQGVDEYGTMLFAVTSCTHGC